MPHTAPARDYLEGDNGAEHGPLTKAKNLTEPYNAAAKQAVRHPAQHVGHSRVPVHGG